MENPDRDIAGGNPVAQDGDMRLLKTGSSGSDKKTVLQRYEWCHKLGRFDWYDVPTVEVEDG